MPRRGGSSAGIPPHQRITLFLNRLEELQNTTWARSGFSPKSRVHGARQADGTIAGQHEYTLAEPIVLKEHLVTIRPFLLANDDVYVPRVHGVLQQALTDESYLQGVARWYGKWKGILKDIHLTIVGIEMPTGVEELTTEQVWELLSNQVLHCKLETVQILDGVHEWAKTELEFQFQMFISISSGMLFSLGENIRRAQQRKLLDFSKVK